MRVEPARWISVSATRPGAAATKARADVTRITEDRETLPVPMGRSRSKPGIGLPISTGDPGRRNMPPTKVSTLIDLDTTQNKGFSGASEIIGGQPPHFTTF